MARASLAAVALLALELRRQESSSKQGSSSGCSTTHNQPAQWTVDQPTIVAEGNTLPASDAEPTTAQRKKAARPARKRGGRSKGKVAEPERTASKDEPRAGYSTSLCSFA